jgi:hypothetical protein
LVEGRFFVTLRTLLMQHRIKLAALYAAPGFIRGWWNYFELADWRREVDDLTGWIRRHMRKCFWLRWHHPRGRLNALQGLGVRGRALGNAYCAKGAWAMARHPTLQQALKNATLHRYGFILPWILTSARK